MKSINSKLEPGVGTKAFAFSTPKMPNNHCRVYKCARLAFFHPGSYNLLVSTGFFYYYYLSPPHVLLVCCFWNNAVCNLVAHFLDFFSIIASSTVTTTPTKYKNIIYEWSIFYFNISVPRLMCLPLPLPLRCFDNHTLLLHCWREI